MSNFYNPLNGPIFLYICGEGPCKGIPSNHTFVAHLCAKFQGMAIALEHRFYGESMPFGKNDHTYSLENLKYLTVEQGLRDIAHFIGWAKSKNIQGISDANPWITVGGSYAGAVSAWFRYLYPHLTIGALASSAVVHSILDF
jgi:hypothetical protein